VGKNKEKSEGGEGSKTWRGGEKKGWTPRKNRIQGKGAPTKRPPFLKPRESEMRWEYPEGMEVGMEKGKSFFIQALSK